MIFRVYLRALAFFLVVLLAVAIYRDITDIHAFSVWRFLTRLIVFVSLAVCLFFRNVWAVRFAYLTSIPVVLLLSLTLYKVGSPVGPTSTAMTVVVLFLLSATIFIPRSELLPEAANGSVEQGEGHGPENPYAPPPSQ